MGWEEEIAELRRREGLAAEMGGPDKVARQHEFGKLTIRERIAAIADAGSFHEIGALAGFEKSGHYFLAEPVGRGYDCGMRVAVEICKLMDRTNLLAHHLLTSNTTHLRSSIFMGLKLSYKMFNPTFPVRCLCPLLLLVGGVR